ncbi:hypothetical protein [Lactobacillus delbrueckii]|uniref:hypothetical protein n=1 Tax=Lactobacillus delbrueckii TaxID=1584 RepID=UPI001E2EFB76|nr:hypothetical protein [Lactobacillus delbrueckii]
MSAEFGMALCALISVVLLSLDLGVTRGRVTHLEHELKNKVELFRNYNESQERFINVLLKHVDQNVCDIKQLSESCGQIDDLGIEVKVCQEHVNHTMDMIEELKAKRSMDILDKLREKDKE